MRHIEETAMKFRLNFPVVIFYGAHSFVNAVSEGMMIYFFAFCLLDPRTVR